jgi:hypothetical protein
MAVIVGKVMINRSNPPDFYPIKDSLLIAVWTQPGTSPIIATPTPYHAPLGIPISPVQNCSFES